MLFVLSGGRSSEFTPAWNSLHARHRKAAAMIQLEFNKRGMTRRIRVRHRM